MRAYRPDFSTTIFRQGNNHDDLIVSIGIDAETNDILKVLRVK